MERLCIFIHIYNKPYISLWPIRCQFHIDLARAPRRARLTARKKGPGYENEFCCENRSENVSKRSSRVSIDEDLVWKCR